MTHHSVRLACQDFLGSLRSAEVSGLAPTESPAKQKSRKKSDGRVFDRLTNPKNFGVVHKNRHDATKRAQKEDDTLNKMIAGQVRSAWKRSFRSTEAQGGGVRA